MSAGFDRIETASRDGTAAPRRERLAWSPRHAFDNVPHYRAGAGVYSDDFRSLDDLKRFPFTTKQDTVGLTMRAVSGLRPDPPGALPLDPTKGSPLETLHWSLNGWGPGTLSLAGSRGGAPWRGPGQRPESPRTR